MVLGLTKSLTEVSTKKMLLGSKARPTRKADNLTDISEQLSRRCGVLEISQPYGPLSALIFLTVTTIGPDM
jgi:hypothetical protein